jgi:F-type H+-transporting ATPase subunit epsilon
MALPKIKFKIVTPERTVFEAEIDQATLPVLDGQITILPNHRSYIAALKPGELMVKESGKDVHMAISGGFIEFNDNALVVLADTAEHADEIDLQRAQAAKQQAEELKKEKVVLDDTEFARVAAAVEKEAARIRVAHKHRTKSGIHLGQ